MSAASLPTETPAWSAPSRTDGPQSLVQITQPLPTTLAPNEVFIRMEAATVNFRDIMLLTGLYPWPAKNPVVPLSDGAGTIIAVGSAVKDFAVGDIVSTVFNPEHQSGPVPLNGRGTGLGGSHEGVARKFAVYPETYVTKAPKGWTAAEAASLPCAALTAWNALYGHKALKAGESVVIQGTGGVSLFALQFAKAAGAYVIATTSSKEKEGLLKKLGADVVINYKENPEWGPAAKELTPGKLGVDHIVDIGGPSTIGQDWKAIASEGLISLIGVGGLSPSCSEQEQNYLNALANFCVVRGVFVGSRQMHEDMVRAINVSGIKPVLDEKRFKFDEVKDCLEYLKAQKHVGKLVIELQK